MSSDSSLGHSDSSSLHFTRHVDQSLGQSSKPPIWQPWSHCSNRPNYVKASPTNFGPTPDFALDLIVKPPFIDIDSHSSQKGSLLVEAAPRHTNELQQKQQQAEPSLPSGQRHPNAQPVLNIDVRNREPCQKIKTSIEEGMCFDQNVACSHFAAAPLTNNPLAQLTSFVTSHTTFPIDFLSATGIGKQSTIVDASVAPIKLHIPKDLCSDSSLQSHLITHTGVKLIACDWPSCGLKFAQSGELKEHMLSHTGEKRFACDMCDKKYERRQKLKQHMNTHTGEKPYACDWPSCKKMFTRSENLRKHLVTHTEKPYSCDWPNCGQSFAYNNLLKRHIKTHTDNDKRFVCKICGKRCARRWTLEQHMLVHSGEKPFACDVCGKKFAQSYHLEYHMNTHTGRTMTARNPIGQCDPRATIISKHT